MFQSSIFIFNILGCSENHFKMLFSIFKFFFSPPRLCFLFSNELPRHFHRERLIYHFWSQLSVTFRGNSPRAISRTPARLRPRRFNKRGKARLHSRQPAVLHSRSPPICKQIKSAAASRTDSRPNPRALDTLRQPDVNIGSNVSLYSTARKSRFSNVAGVI